MNGILVQEIPKDILGKGLLYMKELMILYRNLLVMLEQE
jgi:hypothetical protein